MEGHGGGTGCYGASSTGKDVPSIPDSSGVATLDDAKNYYARHIRGVKSIIVNRKAGRFQVDIDMTENENHAYTSALLKRETGGKKRGVRVFDRERARQMGNIFNVLSRPSSIFEDGNQDLFFGRRDKSGNHHVVVMRWDGRKYRFNSSHSWAHEKFSSTTRHMKPAKIRGKKLEDAK